MGEIAAVLKPLLEEWPYLSRVFFLSMEVCVLAPLLALAVKFRVVRSFRLQSLLWFFLLVNVAAGVVVQAPYAVSPWSRDNGASAPVRASAAHVYRPALRASAGGAGESDVGDVVAGGTTPALAPPAGVLPSPHVAFRNAPWWRILDPARVVFGLWLLGVSGMALHFSLERWRLWRMLKRTSEPPAAIAACYDAEARVLKSLWRPVLRVTDDLETPAIVGVIRPVILVPRWLVEEGSPEQWSWTLRHELTHWRHGDTLGQVIRLVSQGLLFFHPLVWWAGKRWEEAAELACDRSILQTEKDAVGYAQELCDLLGMIGNRQRPLMSTGLFASRTHIGRRIETLLADPLSRPAKLGFFQRVVAAMVLIFLLGVGLGTASHEAQIAVSVSSIAAAATDSDRSEAPASGRVLQFPEGYSMGTLSVGDEQMEARGTVVVPDGASVRLFVNSAGVADLSPLANFGPDDIHSISLVETPVQDEQLAYLQGLTGLRNLNLRETAVTDEGMAYLAGLTQLERLNLNGTAVGDEGMRHVSDMTQMHELILNRTQVSDAGLYYIQGMTQMTYLDMWMLDVTDEGMQYLSGMVHMRELGIEDTLISDAGLRYLEDMQELYELNLENNNITDAGLQSLVKLRSLARLGISDTYITDAGMALFAKIPSLQAARLPIQIGPEGLKHLEGTAVGEFLSNEMGPTRPVTVSITGDGRPLAEAYFSLAQGLEAGEREIYFCRTGPTGDVRVHLPQNTAGYTLRAYAEGYVTDEAQWPTPIPNVLRIDLERASRIGGTVVDESGREVAGVTVSVPVLGAHNWDSNESLPHSVRTDRAGYWSCDVAPRKLLDFWVSLDHPDYATTTYTLADLPVAALQDGAAVLTIADPIGLPGVVVERSGKPIAGASISELEPWRQYGMRPTGRRALSDAGGLFEIKPIRPGDAFLRAEAPGYAAQAMTVHVTASMAPFRIVLDSTGVLRGRVVDEGGEALAGVGVWANVNGENGVNLGDWQGTTDDEGRFEWSEAPDSGIRIFFDRNNEQHLVGNIHPDEEEQLFVVPFKRMAAGVAEGQALIDRYNQRHTPSEMGNIVYMLRAMSDLDPDARDTQVEYVGTLAQDGPFRETLTHSRDEVRTLKWRHSWDGSTYVRGGQEPADEQDLVENDIFVDSKKALEPKAYQMLKNSLVLVQPDSATRRYEVMEFEAGTVSLGDDGAIAARIHFSDLDKLYYDRIEYFDESGRVSMTVEASDWSNYNDIDYPKTIRERYVEGESRGETTIEIEMILPFFPKTEDYKWSIPWRAGVQIEFGGVEEAVEVLDIDRELIESKQYLEALEKSNE